MTVLIIMSLLTTSNAGSASVDYFIRNIGGSGNTGADVPTIKAGAVFNAIRVGDPATGLVIVGGTGSVNPLVSGVRGGQANTAGGASFLLGSSQASQNNIALTDGVVTFNGDVVVSGATSDLSVGGDIILANGATGKSITGYYSVTTAVAASGAQANPAGLTAGTYLVVYQPTGGAQGQQPSGVFYWSGTTWVGNALGANFTAGVPDIAILPTVGNATLTIGGGAASVPGTLFWRKLLG